MKFFNMLDCYVEMPEMVNIDFELAIMNSINAVFKCSVAVCWFHFCENMRIHVSENGLIKSLSNKAVFKCYQWVKCLPFVPLEDVSSAFKIIKESSPPVLDGFIEYVENYYVLGKLKAGYNSIRERIMFPPNSWNVYDRVLRDLPRTNNNIES